MESGNIRDNVAALTRRGSRLEKRGETAEATAVYESAVEQLLEAVSSKEQAPVELLGQLTGVLPSLLTLYRWNDEYEKGLALMERMAEVTPSFVDERIFDISAFLISAGKIEDGLGRLRERHVLEPNNVWLGCFLAAEYIGLERYPEAETLLKNVLSQCHSLSERAETNRMLFEMYRRTSNIELAEEAALAACKSHRVATVLKPKLYRLLTYRGYHPKVLEYLKSDDSYVNVVFYSSLVKLMSGMPERFFEGGFQRLVNDEAAVRKGPDECAEACLYLHKTGKAVEVLRASLTRDPSNSWRTMLLGIAYGLQLDFDNATRFLGTALRLGQNSIPQQIRWVNKSSRPIFDGTARVAYAYLVTESDVKPHLDPYFIP